MLQGSGKKRKKRYLLLILIDKYWKLNSSLSNFPIQINCLIKSGGKPSCVSLSHPRNGINKTCKFSPSSYSHQFSYGKFECFVVSWFQCQLSLLSFTYYHIKIKNTIFYLAPELYSISHNTWLPSPKLLKIALDLIFFTEC